MSHRESCDNSSPSKSARVYRSDSVSGDRISMRSDRSEPEENTIVLVQNPPKKRQRIDLNCSLDKPLTLKRCVNLTSHDKSTLNPKVDYGVRQKWRRENMQHQSKVTPSTARIDFPQALFEAFGDKGGFQIVCMKRGCKGVSKLFTHGQGNSKSV